MGARSTEGSIFLPRIDTRSEEHTSELQSPCNLGWRLLLEKKNRVDERDREGTPRVRRGVRPRRLGAPTSRRSGTTRPRIGLPSGRAVVLIHPDPDGAASPA